MPKHVCYFILFAFVLFSFSSFAAETAKGDHVRISWLAPQQFGPESEEIGILFEIDPEWHIYWKNPGDSGAAPKFNFTNKNVTVSELQWPRPERLPYCVLTNIGYNTAVAFPMRVTPTGSPVEISVALEWLVCKVECIPGFATLTLKRAKGDQSKWKQADQDRLESFSNRVPNFAGSWAIKSTQLTSEVLMVTVGGVEGETPEIFPVDGNFLLANAPKIERSNGDAVYSIPIVKGYPAPKETGFVLALGDRAKEFASVAIGGAGSASPANFTDQDESSLVVLLFFAFIGGILLNLMPCVFPVLSIKLFSLMRGGVTSSERLREGLLYSAGVLFTFTALGAALLVARALGAQAGWGFQLQSPVIVLSLAALFWLMALNFLGVFEMGDSIVGLFGRFNPNSKSKSMESFATGALSVFVAAPCTGPFMGSALGATATLPAVQALSIFVVLGAGLAFPFLVLSMSPKLMAYLPKPGAWMETLKQFLAFPLFATVLWLVWVLGIQIGDSGWVVGSVLFLSISFALWLGRSARKWVRVTAWLIALAMFAVAIRSVREASLGISAADSQTAVTGNGSSDGRAVWTAYDKSKIDAEISGGRPVFIDFTAAWCITCQVNKKTVLESEAGQKIFKDNNVYLVKADWTNQNPVITAALAEFKRNSVPLYLYYAPGKSTPEVLPQILTINMIRDLFKTN